MRWTLTDLSDSPAIASTHSLSLLVSVCRLDRELPFGSVAGCRRTRPTTHVSRLVAHTHLTLDSYFSSCDLPSRQDLSRKHNKHATRTQTTTAIKTTARYSMKCGCRPRLRGCRPPDAAVLQRDERDRNRSTHEEVYGDAVQHGLRSIDRAKCFQPCTDWSVCRAESL